MHERVPHDVLLTPGLATLPVRLDWIDLMTKDSKEYGWRVLTSYPFTAWFNSTGQPAMMLPPGRSEGGLPVSVEAVARDEATLLGLAAQLEAERPWLDRHPPRAG